jgi:hypothetical protein
MLDIGTDYRMTLPKQDSNLTAKYRFYPIAKTIKIPIMRTSKQGLPREANLIKVRV